METGFVATEYSNISKQGVGIKEALNDRIEWGGWMGRGCTSIGKDFETALGTAMLAGCLAQSLHHRGTQQLIMDLLQAPGPKPFSMASLVLNFGPP